MDDDIFRRASRGVFVPRRKHAGHASRSFHAPLHSETWPITQPLAMRQRRAVKAFSATLAGAARPAVSLVYGIAARGSAVHRAIAARFADASARGGGAVREARAALEDFSDHQSRALKNIGRRVNKEQAFSVAAIGLATPAALALFEPGDHYRLTVFFAAAAAGAAGMLGLPYAHEAASRRIPALRVASRAAHERIQLAAATFGGSGAAVLAHRLMM